MKAGDIVISLHNPYKMCIRSIDKNDAVCNYFDRQNELHTVQLPITHLLVIN